MAISNTIFENGTMAEKNRGGVLRDLRICLEFIISVILVVVFDICIAILSLGFALRT